jgi:hypothetical protein
MPRQPRPVAERLVEHMELGDGGCWLSTYRSQTAHGARFVAINGRVRKQVHRVAYELWRGPIPDGLTIDHLCRTPACFNPDHLEPVTMAENLRRGGGTWASNWRKTHCPKGHPSSGDNLLRSSSGARRCRACKREQNQAAYLARKGR